MPCNLLRLSPTMGLALMFAFVGCDKGKDEEARREREGLQELIRKLSQQREQDRRVLEAKKTEAEADTSAAIEMWVATGTCLLIVIVLVARERHIRNLLASLVHHLLRMKERGP